jgi:glutamine cyclotransferase
MKKNLVYFLFVATTLFGCQSNPDTEGSNEPVAAAIEAPINGTYNIVEIYPHNTSSFTQGLVWQYLIRRNGSYQPKQVV